MAQQTIPGTRTLWSILRGYINDNFTEIYTKLFETGKVLTDNNYTTAEKNKLATLTDEVLEYANVAAFPVTGVAGILYVALDTNYVYRWSGSIYVEVSVGITPAQVTALTFATPATIAYTTEIPFTRMLTIITGKTLASNDTLTIGANPVEGAGAQTWLDGNGTNALVLTNFDYQFGDFDSTNGVRNLLTMEYIGAKSIVSIINLTAV